MSIHRAIPAFAVFGLLLLSPAGASGQAVPVERLQAEDRAAGDLFGCALDLRVDERRAVLLVGSLLDDDLGADSGSGYVFELGPGAEAWAVTAKLLAPDGAPGDQLGFAVALAPGGDAALLGAPLAGAGGAVYRFTRGRGGTWEPAGRFTTGEAGAALGSSVAFAGGLAAAGAPTAVIDGQPDAGAVFLFGQAAGPARRLTAAEPRASDAFGWALAFGGGTLAVGAPWADGPFTDTGAVHLFDDAAGPGTRVLAPDAAPFDAFGYAVAVDGDLLAVGAPRADGGAGAVYLFRRGETGFELEARLGGTVPGAQLGTAVALAGGTLAAGARREAGPGPAAGAVRLFRREGGAWVETERFQPGEVRGGDELGIDVALSADGLAAGAYKDDDGGIDAGSVYARVPPREAEEPDEPDAPDPEPVVADLTFEITAGSDVAVPGTPLSYEIEICNLGPSAAPPQAFGGGGFGPSFLDPTWTCAGTGGATCSPTAGAGPIAGTLTLPAGGCVVYDLDVRVAPCARSSLVLAGGLGALPFDPDPSNNADQATTPVSPRADLGVIIATDRTVYRPGETAVLTVTATNGGPSCAFDAAVRALLPPALVPLSWTCAPGPGVSCAGGAGALDDEADLPPGTSAVYTATATVAPGFAGPETVAATVSPPLGLDPAPGDNRASAEIVLLPPPGAVAAVKDVRGAPLEGGVVTYVLVVANGSSVPLPDGTGDEVVDFLPAAVVPLAVRASSGTARIDAPSTLAKNGSIPTGDFAVIPIGPPATVAWNGSIPAGGFVVIEIDVMILDGTLGSEVLNQATAVGLDGELVKSAPPGADGPAPTSFTVTSLLEIPALSTVGLLVLALLLAAGALAFLGRSP